MKKIELEIVAITNSRFQTNSYAVVLGEQNGLRRLPIVIGGYEAQAIAVALEKLPVTRPLTHDLFRNFLYAFNIELREAVIYKLEEGIFYSKLICNNENETLEIDSRTSDALALAVRMGCPVFTFENILDKADSYIEQDSEHIGGNAQQIHQAEPATQKETDGLNPEIGTANLKKMSAEELQDLLQQVLEKEDYVQAIAIRDEMKKRAHKDGNA